MGVSEGVRIYPWSTFRDLIGIEAVKENVGSVVEHVHVIMVFSYHSYGYG